jgi:SHS2 domain-containing protein
MGSINNETGFLEIPHTADWSIRAWAPDYTALLETCALAMETLLETKFQSPRREAISIDLLAEDEESLLVAFLNELLYYGEDAGIGFREFDLQVEPAANGDLRLHGAIYGGTIDSRAKEIKAVTYHSLRVIHQGDQVETTLVFDV